MPGKEKVMSGAQKAGYAALSARNNPYVRRVLEDEELRSNLAGAFVAARGAYRRMSNGKGKGAKRAIAEDKKVQRDLRQAAESLKAASEQLRGKSGRKSKCMCGGRCKCGHKKHRRRRRCKRLFMCTLITGGLILAFSEGARKALLDAVFGSEEEFEYSSTTTPTS